MLNAVVPDAAIGRPIIATTVGSMFAGTVESRLITCGLTPRINARSALSTDYKSGFIAGGISCGLTLGSYSRTDPQFRHTFVGFVDSEAFEDVYYSVREQCCEDADKADESTYDTDHYGQYDIN